jgi:hypothetical protein
METASAAPAAVRTHGSDACRKTLQSFAPVQAGRSREVQAELPKHMIHKGNFRFPIASYFDGIYFAK